MTEALEVEALAAFIAAELERQSDRAFAIDDDLQYFMVCESIDLFALANAISAFIGPPAFDGVRPQP